MATCRTAWKPAAPTAPQPVSRSDSQAVTHDHARAVGSLRLHHRDPFDRMLIAQAQLEGCTVATRDGRFAPYDVPILHV
ncbi:MAG: type II toxin-antitoxin system VapC family toxin [Acidimicrobiia bacterium]|nr:type II toxin-antitoxin system VapC family toxin [Acidimicrobiia bacterium]